MPHACDVCGVLPGWLVYIWGTRRAVVLPWQHKMAILCACSSLWHRPDMSASHVRAYALIQLLCSCCKHVDKAKTAGCQQVTQTLLMAVSYLSCALSDNFQHMYSKAPFL